MLLNEGNAGQVDKWACISPMVSLLVLEDFKLVVFALFILK